MSKRLLIGVGLSLILALWLWRAATAQAAAPPFEQAECPFPIPFGYRIDCGFVSVPEDRTQANGPLIKIGVAIARSRSAHPAPDPVFFLNGGPGGAIIGALPNFAPGFDPIISARDVVFFDQRGAGWSQPALLCPETDAPKIAVLKGQQFSLAPYLACRDRWQRAGVNLAAYTTTANAADVEDVRRALGYDQINLYGVSYGTMLAQVILRDWPAHIRSAVLDSAYPIWEYVRADAPLSLTHYLDTVFTNCEQDLVCRAAYPDVRAVFAQLVARLRQQPLIVTHSDPITHESFTTTLDHVGLIGWLIYTPPQRLPGLLYDLRDGEIHEVIAAQRAMLKEAYQPQWPLSEGMRISMLCHLRLVQVTPQQIAATNAQYPVAAWANNDSATMMALCAQWPTRPIEAREAEPLRTDVPLLVIGGEYDPGSPPRYAETIAATSAHGYAFTVPSAGHGALINADPCAKGMVYSFLNDPLREPASDCLGNTRGSGFVLRAAITRPVMALLAVALSGALAWSTWRGVGALRQRQYGWTWRISLRLLGWWPVAASAGALIVARVLHPSGVEALQRERLIETIVPLLAGIQAAFLFSPEDEPGLEVTLACPRPLAWTIGERLLWLLALQGSVALIGSVLIGPPSGESFSVVIARWIAPLVFFAGLGLCLTLITRQAVMSVGLVMILWTGLMLASDLLAQRWPFLWPIGVYLQPDQPDFWLNRLVLLLGGGWLIRLAITRLSRNDERLLLGVAQRKRSARKEGSS